MFNGEVEFVAKSEMGNVIGEREIVYVVVEIVTKSKMGKARREIVYRLVKIMTKGKVSERVGEVFNRAVKFVSKREVGERGWKIVYFLIKMVAKMKVSNESGEIVGGSRIFRRESESWHEIEGILNRKKYYTTTRY